MKLTEIFVVVILAPCAFFAWPYLLGWLLELSK